MTASHFHYELYGLRLASEIAFPELPSLPAPSTAADVRIRVGEIPRDLPDSPGFHRLGQVSLLNVAGTARYCCLGEGELLVEPRSGAPPRNVRLFLLGSALALVLHRRGLLPLHGNSVEIEGRAHVFLGPSGSGKSTLAAWFHDRGFPIIADDVSVVRLEAGGEAVVTPGLPRFRLWREAIERSGRSFAGLRRSFEEEGEDVDKFDVPATRTASEPVALGSILWLERGAPSAIIPLAGGDAVEALFANIYRGEFLSGQQHRQHWRQCVALARSHPVGRWVRPWNVDAFEREGRLLLERLKSGSR